MIYAIDGVAEARPKYSHISQAHQTSMDNRNDEPISEIESLLKDVAQESDIITEDIIIKIYEVEKELSTLDRRHGIKNKIQNILEEKGLDNEGKKDNS